MTSRFTFSDGIDTSRKITFKDPESLEGTAKNTSIKQNTYTVFSKDNLYTIGDGDGELPYDERSFVSRVHWGQLKLFMSELQPLVYYGDINSFSEIVYVGAAPGEHTYVLAQMFPQFNFHLYDKQTFDRRLEKMKNVKLYKKYFEQEDIEYWKKSTKKIFFISDIRSLNYQGKSKNRAKAEQIVWENMKLQQSWYEEIKPYAGLFKFKLPYMTSYNLAQGSIRNYLDGIIFRQVFQRPNSSETRLFVRGMGYSDWNIETYEKKLFYHNAVVREKALYKNPIDLSNNPVYKEKGFTNNYDSVCSAMILKDYLQKVNAEVNISNVRSLIDYIVDNITPSGENKLITKNLVDEDDD